MIGIQSTKLLIGLKVWHRKRLMRSALPRGIPYLYCLHGLTTFSFAVLFSSLALYLTSSLQLSHEESNSIVGLFLAFNFGLHLISGYIGGRFLSHRLLYILSLLAQIIGVYLLSQSNLKDFFWGLSFFVVGCGFNSTCLNCLLTQQFDPADDRRETAFFMSYCATNIGFFMGFLAGGIFDSLDNYQTLFYISNVVNAITFVLCLFSWKYLKDRNTPLLKTNHALLSRYRLIGSLMMVLLIPLVLIGFQQSNRANDMILILGTGMLGLILYFAVVNKNRLEGNKILAFLILTVSSIIFWMIYFVGPMGMMHFLKYNANVTLFDYKIPPQWIMNLNSIFIIAGSPTLAFILSRLRQKGFNIPISRQFIVALIAIAISFYLLSIGIFFVDSSGLISRLWVVLHFLTQAIGELLLAPVGYAMIGKLAPVNLQGIMMGTWMMVSGIAATLAHYFSNGMTQSEATNPLITNVNYFDTFNKLGLYALIGAVVLYILSSRIDVLINEKPDEFKENEFLEASH